MSNTENLCELIEETHPDKLKTNDVMKCVREFLKKIEVDKKIINLVIKHIKQNYLVPSATNFIIYSHAQLCLLAQSYCEELNENSNK